MPARFRQSDPNTITDVIIHLKYTARDGGSTFRTTVENALRIKRLESENRELRQRVGKHHIVWTGDAMRRVMIHPTGNTRQTGRGNILIGTTYENNTTERLTTISGLQKIYDDIVRRYPVMKDVTILRHFAGIRPLPQDGKPYLGAVKYVPGLFVATSHSGITLSPVHGKVISELILDGGTEVRIDSYRPERHMADQRLGAREVHVRLQEPSPVDGPAPCGDQLLDLAE